MKVTKFLSIGILSVLSVFQAASANNLTNGDIQNIQNIFNHSQINIQETVAKHLNTPFFNEHANVTVNLVYDQEEYSVNDNEKLKSIAESNNSYSPSGSNSNTVSGYFYRQNNTCELKINIGLNGEALNLSPYKDVISMTTPTNDRQRDLAQQFIILHELAHCNFGKIENPIIIPGASQSDNEEFSHILKDQFQDHFGDNITYIGLLFDNEADISSIYALIREHGADDVDLQFIQSSVIAQRQSNYFHRNKDPHFTHLGLSEALKPENIEKMLSIQGDEEMQKHVLEMANLGVLKIAADNPTIANELFSKDNFMLGFMSNFIEILNETYKKGEVSNFWHDSTKRGLTYELAQKIFYTLEVNGTSNNERFVESLQYMQNNFNFDFGYWDNRKLTNAHNKISSINDYVISLRSNLQNEMANSKNQYKSQQRFFDMEQVKEQMQNMRNSQGNVIKKANPKIG